MCASHCAQLLHTISHRTDLIVFPLTLQTITTSPMMSIWGKGGEWNLGMTCKVQLIWYWGWSCSGFSVDLGIFTYTDTLLTLFKPCLGKGCHLALPLGLLNENQSALGKPRGNNVVGRFFQTRCRWCFCPHLKYTFENNMKNNCITTAGNVGPLLQVVSAY